MGGGRSVLAIDFDPRNFLSLFLLFISETGTKYGISRVGCRSNGVDRRTANGFTGFLFFLFFSITSINLFERDRRVEEEASSSLLKLSPILPVPLINKPFFV